MQIGMELGGYWPSDRTDIENLFPEMMNVVRKADEIGLDAMVVGEHHFMDYGNTPSPLALVAHIAAVVKIPRLVAAILMMPLHDAPVLAGTVAEVDHLTGGRLEIGPGRGGAPYEFERCCRPGDGETTREIFEEQFKALRMLMTQNNVSYDGKYTKFDNVTIMPPVLQKPYPPIWQTCQREEAAFHSAKNGYHVFTSSLRRPMSYVESLRKAFDEGVKESAKPQGEPQFAHLQWVYLAKDDADAREKLELAYIKQRKFWSLWTNDLTPVDAKIPEKDMPVSIDELAEGLIIGTKSYVEDRLLQLQELGTDLMVMKTGFGQSNADEMAGLDRIAEHILPIMQDRHTKAPVPAE